MCLINSITFNSWLIPNVQSSGKWVYFHFHSLMDAWLTVPDIGIYISTCRLPSCTRIPCFQVWTQEQRRISIPHDQPTKRTFRSRKLSTVYAPSLLYCLYVFYSSTRSTFTESIYGNTARGLSITASYYPRLLIFNNVIFTQVFVTVESHQMVDTHYAKGDIKWDTQASTTTKSKDLSSEVDSVWPNIVQWSGPETFCPWRSTRICREFRRTFGILCCALLFLIK